ncbi:MAG: type II toxin-antitoxin system Phd/YefM family antitoxin [Nitrospirota bacterium]|nr:type II toxin-antitoxin system Phd/YefM family antitoxin [Nitrospirota bacterium]MDH5775195.1 type II toxin-antitoxin system Phd/YefM family antitoxin [Nitrospirota bacterium]
MKPTAAKEVSAFDAKTHLSALLRETEKGQSFVIHRRGKPVAWLGPPPGGNEEQTLRSIHETLQSIRQEIPGKLNVRKLIEEGRKK